MSKEFKYKTEEHIVAFIDLLGASEQIYKDADYSLNAAHTAYDMAMKLYTQFPTLLQGKLKINIFSDNIVVSAPITDDNKLSMLKSVVTFSALIQAQFLLGNILVRGGITKGSFFADELMVWGKALVDAYSVESSIAIYPRIVIHPEVIGEFGLARDKQGLWIQQDRDRLFFVDYMNPKTMREDTYDFRLLACLSASEKMLINTNSLKVQQKILWHISYLQNILEKYNQSE